MSAASILRLPFPGKKDGGLKQVGRMEYLLRHLRQILPYTTPAKIINLALNVIELKLLNTRPWSSPPYIKVEPTPLCQLACPGCAHGTSDLKKQLTNRMHVTLEEYKKLIDPIARTLFGVSLSLRGEPLLGKDILPIIEYSHAKNIAVSFPTNLSLHLREEQIERLVRSGLDTMYVSLDGTSEETYNRYRVGGDFELVRRNVGAIAAMKRRLGSPTPRLIWKFVVFRHNAHEVPQVLGTYEQLGFDAYELVQDYGDRVVKTARREHKTTLQRKKKGCYWAWHTTVVRADGVVNPCCHEHADFGLGNLKQASLRAIWRGAAYARLRQGFKSMRAADMHPICVRCLGVPQEAPSAPAPSRV
jgi:MoaA/NifB/PqqE/SkfB family radical SAM enzyme